MLLVLSLLFSISVVVVAAESDDISSVIKVEAPLIFTDVGASSAFADDILWAKDEGIISGYSDGSFKPDAFISKDAAIAFSKYVCTVDEPISDKVIELFLQDKNVVENTVTVSRYLALLFQLKGMRFYDTRVYDPKTINSLSGSAIYMAVDLGWVPDVNKVKEPITRAEALHFLHLAKQLEEDTPQPPIVKEFRVEEESPGIYPVTLIDLHHIPKPIKQRFVKDEWSIKIGDSYMKEYNKTHKEIHAIGLTSYTFKTCYIGDNDALFHEVGHFYDRLLDNAAKHNVLCKAEAKAASKVLGPYSETNTLEYFGEYFAFWLRNPEGSKGRLKLKEVSPLTYEYFTSLEESNWFPDKK